MYIKLISDCVSELAMIRHIFSSGYYGMYIYLKVICRLTIKAVYTTITSYIEILTGIVVSGHILPSLTAATLSV